MNEKVSLDLISQVVANFGAVNNDIHTIKQKVEEQLRKLGKEPWKKKRGNNFYDFEGFLESNTDKAYILNVFYTEEENGAVVHKGLSFLVAIGTYANGRNSYRSICDKLEINPSAPMVCLYGVFSTNGHEPAFVWDGLSWSEALIGLDESDNNREKLEKNYSLKEIIIHKPSFDDDYEGWFKQATFKTIPITDINSQQKIEELVDELDKMRLK
jgi:hypothetical protein